MQPRLFLNGRFLAQRLTGVQRSAREIVLALDSLLAHQPDFPPVTLLVPPGADVDLPLRHIAIEQRGVLRGQAWEQLELPLLSAGGLLLSFANLGPLLRRRQAVVIHDAQVWDIPENFSRMFRLWYRLALPMLGRRAKLVLTVSEFSRAALARHGVVDAERAVVLYNGADHILRRQADTGVLEKSGLRPGQFVLAVGSRNRNKNVALVAAAAPELGRLGLDVVVAGAANPAVFGAGPGMPQGTSVRELGYVDDDSLRALYEAAACFAFPSIYEGFGLPAVEAMACGCPVVTSRLGACPEVCADAALYCDVEDPTELVEQVRALTLDTQLRDRQVARGRARAAQFTWEAAAARIADLARTELRSGHRALG